MSVSVKDIAASVVLALLFISLVAIYLVTSQNWLVTGLSVVILAISLVVTIDGGWSEVAVIGTIGAIVSLIAVALVGRLLFNTPGVIIFTLLWAAVLFFLFNWISRNIIRVPRDRAIIVARTYTGNTYIPEGPISPPIFPILERRVAVIPKYELGNYIEIGKVNTKAGHNIDMIKVHVNYQITNPRQAMKGILNPSIVQREVARELGSDLEEARNRTEFWERLFNRQMIIDVDNVVRDVIFTQFDRASDAYRGRANPQFREAVFTRLKEQIANWGAELIGVDVDHFDVDGSRFRTPDDETKNKQREAEREATRITLVRNAEANAEAERVSRLVETLKSSGVELSPALIEDIVVSAIQASSEWGLDNDYRKLTPDDAPAGAKK